MLWAWLGALAVSAAAAAASFPDPGSSWPTKEETAVIGLVGAKGFVEYGSAPFLLFSNISNSEVSTLDSAKSNGGVWTCQRSQKKLSALSSAVQLKWAGKVKVIVKRAWMAPLQGSSGNCDAQEAKIPSQPTLYNEGRAVDVQLEQDGKVIVNSTMMGELAALAAEVKFDFVRHYQASESSSTAYIYLSSISDNCQTKVDLMFVVDMSGSITPEGYHSEQKFIATLVDFFDIGPDQTLVSMISFDASVRLDFKFKEHTTA
eukprot:gene4951-4678_t